jgi:hypothetical protein
VDIFTFAFYLHLESLGFDGTIYSFKHPYNIPAFSTAADWPSPGSNTI